MTVFKTVFRAGERTVEPSSKRCRKNNTGKLVCEKPRMESSQKKRHQECLVRCCDKGSPSPPSHCPHSVPSRSSSLSPTPPQRSLPCHSSPGHLFHNSTSPKYSKAMAFCLSRPPSLLFSSTRLQSQKERDGACVIFISPVPSTHRHQEAITAGTSREMGKFGIHYIIQLGRNGILNGIHPPFLLKACA